jgi:hypothetical protein
MLSFAVGLTPGTYVIGSVSATAVAASLGFGAWSLRRAVLPEWGGAPARLAEVVIALAVLFGVAQVLGTFGGFRRDAMFLACIATATVMGVVGHRLARSRSGTPPHPPAADPRQALAERVRAPDVVAAVAAAAVVSAQWFMHVGYALTTGMTHPDTLWYHAPYAARFVQTGWLMHLSDTGLSDVATPLHSYLPLNGSLAHAIVMLPFHSDFLSVFLNLGWFALALFAGWCIGRRGGVAGLTMLAMVVLLGMPTLAGTQPGQASNDVATLALFIAGIALLVEGWMRVAPTALAGIGVGLGVAIKLTILAPLALLTLGVVVAALRARRKSVAIAWCVALVLSGGYWLVRNWIVAGNPLPWSEISLGPISFDAVIKSRPELIYYLDDWTTWDRFILPGLDKAFGPAWPLLVGLALLGAVLGVVVGRHVLERWAGASALLGIVAFPFIPFSGDLRGGAVVFMLRYLAPEIMIGLWLLALVLARIGGVWRWAGLVALVATAAVNVTAPHIEDIPAWPSGQVVAGALGGLAVLSVSAVVVLRYRLSACRTLAAGVIVIAVTGIASGWLLQERYFEDRYVHAGLPHDGANALFRNIENERVAVLGTEHFYPFFGLKLSNFVSAPNGPTHGSEIKRCREWREVLRDGGFTYVVVAHDIFAHPPPDEAWLISDSSVRTVHRDRDTVVYRIDGALDPNGCR